MRSRWPICLALSFVLSILCSALAEEPKPFRLAILPDAEDGSGLRDLAAELEAAFTGVKGIELVERTELQKILREQGLGVSGLLGPDGTVAIRKLAPADGLLILTAEWYGGPLHCRLVRVSDGGVLADDDFLPTGKNRPLVCARVRGEVLEAIQRKPDSKKLLTVAVGEFANGSGAHRSDSFGLLLRQALIDRMKYEDWAEIVERETPTSILNESELGRTGLTTGAAARQASADIFIMGSYRDVSQEFQAKKPWLIRVDVLVLLHKVVSSMTLTCREAPAEDRLDEQVGLAEKIVTGINEMRQRPPQQKSDLTEKEFWRRYALVVLPAMDYGDASRCRMVARAWENVLLFDPTDMEARLNLGTSLLDYCENLAFEKDDPREAFQDPYVVSQCLRGNRLIEAVLRTQPTPAHAKEFCHAAYAGLWEDDKGIPHSYAPERSIEMLEYIAANPVVFTGLEAQRVQTELRRLRQEPLLPALRTAVEQVGKDPLKADALLAEFFDWDRADAATKAPEAWRYAAHTNPVVRFRVETFLARLCIKEKDRAALEHYDRAIEALEPSRALLLQHGATPWDLEEMDTIFLMRVYACEALNDKEEARKTVLRGIRHFIAADRINDRISELMLYCVTEMLGPDDAALGVEICDGCAGLCERGGGNYSRYRYSAIISCREVFKARIEKRPLPNFGAMKLIFGAGNDDPLGSPTMAVAGGKLWLTWQTIPSSLSQVYDPVAGRVEALKLASDAEDGNPHVNAVVAMGERIYVAGDGLIELNTEGQVMKRFDDDSELPSGEIKALCSDGSKLYMGIDQRSWKKGVAVLDPKTRVTTLLAPTRREADYRSEPVKSFTRLWWDPANKRLYVNDFGDSISNAWWQTEKGWVRLKDNEPKPRFIVCRDGEALQLTISKSPAGQSVFEFLGTGEKITCDLPLPDEIGEPAWDEHRIWVPGYTGLYEIERQSGKMRWLAFDKDNPCLSVIRLGDKLYVATRKGLYAYPVPE